MEDQDGLDVGRRPALGPHDERSEEPAQQVERVVGPVVVVGPHTPTASGVHSHASVNSSPGATKPPVRVKSPR